MSEPQPDSAAPPQPHTTRLEQMAECVHRQALDGARLRDEIGTLHGRLQAVDADRLAAENVQLSAELAVTRAELERLRALPELRAGQRLRHTARRGPPADASQQQARPGPTATPDAPVSAGRSTPAEPTPHEPTPAAPDRGLGYPEPSLAAIVVVRNRRAGLEPLLDWLGERGVERVEIVDDATADPATLELLAALGPPVHRLEAPLGPLGPWALGLVAELSLHGPVIVVDADTLPGESCRDDVLARLVHELVRRPDLDAVDLDTVDRTGQPPTGAATGPPLFRVVRPELPRLPVEIATLDPPYLARRASWNVDADDPGERFARRADRAGDD